MTDPQVPIQLDPPLPPTPLPPTPPVLSATGIDGTVTFDGANIVFTRTRGDKTKSDTIPLASVAAVAFAPPTTKPGLFGLIVRTTNGDVAFDSDRPDGRRSAGFTTAQADGFRALARAVDEAKPKTPTPMRSDLLANGRPPFHKRWWFWAIVVVAVLSCLFSPAGGGDNTDTSGAADSTATSQTDAARRKEAAKADADLKKAEAKAEAQARAEQELRAQADGYKGQDAANIINDPEQKGQLGAIGTGDGTDQTDAVKSAIAGGTAYTVTGATVSDDKIDLTVDTTDHYNRQQEIANATPEQSSALTKARSYSTMMHMSRQGIYDQLTSEYGEKFSPDAANWALDHLDADYNANALAKAKDYQSTMAMSPEAIRDQLTSQYGEKFTPDEADYAIEHLNDQEAQ